MRRVSDEVAAVLASAAEDGFDARSVADRALARLVADTRREARSPTPEDLEVAATLLATGVVDRPRLVAVLEAVRVGTEGRTFAGPEGRVDRATGSGVVISWTLRSASGTATRVEAAEGVVDDPSDLIPVEVEDLARAMAELDDDEIAAVSRRVEADASYARALLADPVGALAAYREDDH